MFNKCCYKLCTHNREVGGTSYKIIRAWRIIDSIDEKNGTFNGKTIFCLITRKNDIYCSYHSKKYYILLNLYVTLLNLSKIDQNKVRI